MCPCDDYMRTYIVVLDEDIHTTNNNYNIIRNDNNNNIFFGRYDHNAAVVTN